jgi:hypothetical protein
MLIAIYFFLCIIYFDGSLISYIRIFKKLIFLFIISFKKLEISKIIGAGTDTNKYRHREANTISGTGTGRC